MAVATRRSGSPTVRSRARPSGDKAPSPLAPPREGGKKKEKGDARSLTSQVEVIPLYTRHTCPDHVRDDYLVRGYRGGLTFRQCVRSLFMFHNETWNVWTHLIGWVVFVVLTVHVAFYIAPDNTFDSAAGSIQAHIDNATAVRTGFFAAAELAVEGVYSEKACGTMFSEPTTAPPLEVCGALHRRLGSYFHHMDLSAENEKLLTDLRTLVTSEVQPYLGADTSGSEQSLKAVLNGVLELHQWAAGAASVAMAGIRREAEAAETVRNAVLVRFSEAGRALEGRYPLVDLRLVEQHLHERIDEWKTQIHNLVAAPAGPEFTPEGGDQDAVRAKAEWILHHGVDAASGPHKYARWPLVLYCVAAQICMLASASFHLFACHSPHATVCFGMCDFSGISIHISATLSTGIFYTFYNDLTFRWAYTFFVVFMGVTLIVSTLWPRFLEDDFRLIRAVLYFFFGGFCLLPAGHLFWKHGVQECTMRLLGDMVVGIVLYLAGLAFFVSRFPERFYPGTFDIHGSSHQWWHVFVFAGTLHGYIILSRMWMVCYELDWPMTSALLLE